MCTLLNKKIQKTCSIYHFVYSTYLYSSHKKVQKLFYRKNASLICFSLYLLKWCRRVDRINPVVSANGNILTAQSFLKNGRKFLRHTFNDSLIRY